MDDNTESGNEILTVGSLENNEFYETNNYSCHELVGSFGSSSELDGSMQETESLVSSEQFSSLNYSQEENAAILIQKAFREYLDNKTKAKSFLYNDENTYTDEEYIAALIIQNHYRNFLEKKLDKRSKFLDETLKWHQDGLKDEKKIKKNDTKKEKAAAIIQHTYREHRNRQIKENQKNAAMLIQKQYRTHLIDRKNSGDTLFVRRQKEMAAKVIQMQYRKHLTRREDFQKEDHAARIIQNQYIKYKIRSEIKLDTFTKENTAATKIQIQYSKYKHHQNLVKQEKNKAATKIQRRFRRHLQSKKDTEASKLIQTEYRKYLKKRKSTSDIPTIGYNNNNGKDSDKRVTEENSVIKIQKNYRHYRKKKSETETQLKRNKAASKIQRRYRKYLNLKKETQLKRNQAASKIQMNYRKRLQEKTSIREKYEHREHLHVFKKCQKQDYGSSSKQSSINNISNVISYNSEDDLSDVSITPFIEKPSKSITPDLTKTYNVLKPIIKKETELKLQKSNDSKKPFGEIITANKNRAQVVKIQKPVIKYKSGIMRNSLENKRIERKAKKQNINKTDKTYLQRLKGCPKKPENEKQTADLKLLYSKQDKTKKPTTTFQHVNNKEQKLLERKSSVRNPTERQSIRTKQIERQLSERMSIEPELLILGESSDNISLADSKSPSLNMFQRLEKHRSTQSMYLSEDEQRYPNSLQHNSTLYEDYNLFYGEQIATNRNKASYGTIHSTRVSSSNQNNFVPTVGNLDSYSVQNMLKKNDLTASQNEGDNNSYLHTYLKQTKLLNENTVSRVKQPNRREHQYRYKEENIHGQPGRIPSSRGLEKIAGYGRNQKPDEWRSLVDLQNQDVPDKRDISRGSFYPIIPSYGQLQSRQNDDAEFREIPWPTGYG